MLLGALTNLQLSKFYNDSLSVPSSPLHFYDDGFIFITLFILKYIKPIGNLLMLGEWFWRNSPLIFLILFTWAEKTIIYSDLNLIFFIFLLDKSST